MLAGTISMPGPIKAQSRTRLSALLYQLEYHMKTTVKSRLVRSSAAVVAAAILGVWFMFGGAQSARAEDAQILSLSGQDMVLMPVKAVNELEQRVIYLEETVAALTESWQHINTHRLCVSDDAGAETCVTKVQLDLLLSQLPRAEIGQASTAQEAVASTPAGPVAAAEPIATAEPVAAAEAVATAEPVEVAVTAEPSPPSEPTTLVVENVRPDQAPESTGTVTLSSDGPSTGAAVLSSPQVEIYEPFADDSRR
jgi:hypothetical protein